MRIHFERGGGFVPSATRLSYITNLNELPAEEASELRKLIESADIGSLAKQPNTRRPRPDAFSYRISVDDENGSSQVVTSDSDMPASLRPLITWLVKQATQSR